MARLRGTSAVVVATAIAAASFVSANPASASIHWWSNCTDMHHMRYAHGVGKTYAHDHTSGTPVTNFYHSTNWYNFAVSHNARLDADHDGIACEAH